MRILFIIAFIATVQNTQGLNVPCGRLLEADAGEFQLPHEENIERGQVCVWIVKLISRQIVRFNLTQLAEGLTVSLYEEHGPCQLSAQPKRLNSSNVGVSVDNDGQTLIVILTQNGSGQGFAFTWDSIATIDPELLTAASYTNQESGQVLWNRFNNRGKLTISLNTDQSQSLDVEAITDFRDCILINQCQCSYVALYEITSDGNLRELSVVCGRTSQVKIETLYPNVLAFVYLDFSQSVSEADFAEIKWNASNSHVPSPTTEASTPPSPGTHECGGTPEVGTGETVIRYLPPGGIKNKEWCVWTLKPTASYSGLTFDYVSYDLDNTYDGVAIYSWDHDGNVTTTRLETRNSSAKVSLSQPFAAIAFSSNDEDEGGLGFQLTIRGTGRSEDYNCQSFVFNQTETIFSYPEYFGFENYKPNERVAIALQTTIPYTVRILKVYFTDIQDDSLIAYELYPYWWGGKAYLIGRTNGSNSEGDSALTTMSDYPILYIFHSNDNSNTGKGFSISSGFDVVDTSNYRLLQ